MKVSEIRQKFLKFFQANGHEIVPSASLVPATDPTLLFTNAGMAPFKDVFLGIERRSYTRAASAQRCVRAGGKHNDLENVGYTARHHTFFEMLGNFSFGDYFKDEAIRLSWKLLTEVYQLPPDKLWVTVYHDDDEAYDIWAHKIGVPSERIVRIGDRGNTPYVSDNFWQMGPVGPCGPCSEIFYDHGQEVLGGPPGSAQADGDRYIEIWNLVFMQFNRDESGCLTPLPKLCIDTGMGLERIAAVLQGVHSNYEIDLFVRLIRAAAQEIGVRDHSHPSLKVIADHLRACVFLMADGILPGNEGRSYVLRRIIRRAIRHGHRLSRDTPFLYKLVEVLVTEMGEAYPELVATQSNIVLSLQQEEARFFDTLEQGISLLNTAIDAAKAQKVKPFGVISGEVAFKLHDTYGFPLDLTNDICREQGLKVDISGFEAAMNRQREAARAASQFKSATPLAYQGAQTIFCGEDHWDIGDATVVALYADGVSSSVPVESLEVGQSGIVVLDRTPFYACAGGQVGDCGVLSAPEFDFSVTQTDKLQADVSAHHGILNRGRLVVGAQVRAAIDAPHRLHVMRHHSATHLLHRALREVLGEHVQQKGSWVDANKIRFDFSHPAALTSQDIHQVEFIVNREILRNTPTKVQNMPYDKAVASGAMALFGEKYETYGEKGVRVLDIGFSRELCGGTHVARTGDIGFFKIVFEGGVAAGVRRVEAVAGEEALRFVQKLEAHTQAAAAQLKTSPTELISRIAQLQEQQKSLEAEIARLKAAWAFQQSKILASQAIDVGGVHVLTACVEGVDVATLRTMVDRLKNKLGSAAIVLASTQQKKIDLVAGVTSPANQTIKAGALVNFVAQQVGGKGGGRADMAQAGGDAPEKLTVALDSVKAWIQSQS